MKINKTIAPVIFSLCFVFAFSLVVYRWYVRVNDSINYTVNKEESQKNGAPVVRMRMPVTFFFDSTLRYNEVCCSHTGVNPFDVWDRKVETRHYRGYHRYDKPYLNVGDLKKKMVHAYPPWHTTFFWFYGWMSPLAVKIFLLLLNATIVICGCLFVWKRVSHKNAAFILSFAFACSTLPFVDVFFVGNYGILITGLFLLLLWSLQRDLNVLAGLCWALMMIKPQMTILLFWPLLFQKRYVAIGVAVATCLLATLWPAFIYGESPIDLILQIPEIGRPYAVASWNTPFGILTKLFGKSAFLLVPGSVFILCGIWSYLVRNATSWIIRFSPALLLFPYWTYSQRYDRIILIVLYALIAFAFLANQSQTLKRILCTFMTFAIIDVVFVSIWSTAVICFKFKPGIGPSWFYLIFNHAMYFALVAIVLIITRKESQWSKTIETPCSTPN